MNQKYVILSKAIIYRSGSYCTLYRVNTNPSDIIAWGFGGFFLFQSSPGYVESTCEWNCLLLIDKKKTSLINFIKATIRGLSFSCRSF
jgi:hypothetical protein